MNNKSILPLIQNELNSWGIDRWKSQKVSLDDNLFIIKMEMMSMADLRPGNPTPNLIAQREYLKVGYECVKKYAPKSPCTIYLIFDDKIINFKRYTK